MPKRRFGVSINEDIAGGLNIIAERLGIDRSTIVETALRSVLGDLSHYIIQHDCTAIITYVCEKSIAEVESIIWGYKELKITQIHNHTGDRCMQILLVTGPSNVIADLYSNLVRVRGCKTVYLPLHSLEDSDNRREETR